MTFPASPTFQGRFKRPLASTFPTAPTFPPSPGAPTCVDVVGQPEISLVDFNGLTGLNFVTGGQGLCFFVPLPVPVNAQNGFYVWFNTGTENASVIGSNNAVEVDIQTTDTAVSIVSEAVSAISLSPYDTYISPSQVNGAGSETGLQLTAQSNVQYGTVTDGISGSSLTGAVFSQTQPGYPSGHYCTPMSDALAAFSFLIRPQTNFLGVGTISGLGPGYIPVDPFKSNAQLLWSDAAGTVPANTQGATVENNTDPISGLALVQSNSMNAPTLQFIQNANGLWVTTMAFNGMSDSLATAGNIGITGAAARTVFFVAKTNSLESGTFGAFFSMGSDVSNGEFSALVNNGNWRFGGGNDQTGSAADLNWHVHCLSFDGTNVNWQIDGLSSITNFPVARPSMNTTAAPLLVGAYPSGGVNSFFLDGSIAAGPIVFAGTLTDSQKTTIFNYLAAPLGIVIS